MRGTAIAAVPGPRPATTPGCAPRPHLPTTGTNAQVLPAKPGLVLFGVHGGAGTSTLVRLLDPGYSGRVVEWRYGMPVDAARVPVLVARSTAAGLAAAAVWVTRWRPDLRRPALMVVADVPFRVPPLVRYRRRALASRVTAVIDVPYLYPLRHLDDPAQALRQRKVAAAVERVRRQLDQLSASVSGG
ncbi:hypothetical protein [Actinomadura keratinilytica]|jgi:hypothetical protein|uniref:Uncharacterized protein n=1 Tax=Actinomadura keratinilytica TaxID=547461 RepID=A0ABP7Z535_9ACTN